MAIRAWRIPWTEEPGGLQSLVEVPQPPHPSHLVWSLQGCGRGPGSELTKSYNFVEFAKKKKKKAFCFWHLKKDP